MTNVISFDRAKDPEKADKVLVPLYQELAALELQVKMLRGAVLAKERQLLTTQEAAHRRMMRAASKIDW